MIDSAGENAAEVRAYRQAGHVLMAYLILKAGSADRFFALPIQDPDRAFLVPDFDTVDLMADLAQSERPSPSLRSLITTPLFLLGGEAAERIYRGTPTSTALGNSTAVSRAWGMMLGYMEEYGGRESPGWDARLSKVLKNYYEFVENQVRDHWACLTELAQQLQVRRALTRDAAFKVLERRLPEKTRIAVARIARADGEPRP